MDRPRFCGTFRLAEAYRVAFAALNTARSEKCREILEISRIECEEELTAVCRSVAAQNYNACQ